MEEQELPPFAVPASYRLESELEAPQPRPVPDSIRRHPKRLAQLRSKRKWSLLLTFLSVLGIIFAKSFPVLVMGLYITPFAHLSWLAPLLLAVGVWGIFGFWRPSKADPYAYLRHGIPVVGEVVDLRIEVTQRVNGHDTTFAYDVYLRFLDPDTQKIAIARLRSHGLRPEHAKLKCRVGDYLTALYLPGQPETLTLYGFTRINPERDLVEHTPRRNLKLAFAILFGTIGLCASFFAYPLASASPALLTTLLVGTLLGGVWGLKHSRKTENRLQAEYKHAVASGLPVVGQTVRHTGGLGWLCTGMFVAGLGTFAALQGINGLFDFSQPTLTQVRVTSAHSVTYQLLFTTYKVTYIDPTTQKSESLSVSPFELMGDNEPNAGLLETHRGALGAPWQRIHVFHDKD